MQVNLCSFRGQAAPCTRRSWYGTGASRVRQEKASDLTPKTFSRISRFLNICHHLDGYLDSKLTRLAHECGYFDQAHFIREFCAFTGFTPKAFFAKNNVKFTDP